MNVLAIASELEDCLDRGANYALCEMNHDIANYFMARAVVLALMQLNDSLRCLMPVELPLLPLPEMDGRS